MPDGYELYQRGTRLLERGSWHAASVVLRQARDIEPDKTSIREALARALFRSSRFAEAADEFRQILEANPASDYSHYGLGLAARRLGDLACARKHLKLACAMAPHHEHYSRALAAVMSVTEGRGQPS